MALEDHLFAVDDRHVGQRQLEDDCKGRRSESNSVEMSTSTRMISVAVSSVPRWCLRAHDMSLNVRPSNDCRRRRNATANCWRHGPAHRPLSSLLAERPYSLVEPALDDGRLVRPLETLSKSGILQFLSSKCKRNTLCVAPSFRSLSVFFVRRGKGPFLHQLLPRLLVSRWQLGKLAQGRCM